MVYIKYIKYIVHTHTHTYIHIYYFYTRKFFVATKLE
jgi:hypothetical protein